MESDIISCNFQTKVLTNVYLILMISNNLIKILKLTDVHFLMETINCWQLFGVADNIYGVDITA